MDTIITFKEFQHLPYIFNEKYKHFNQKYHKTLVDFHTDELMLKTYKRYLKVHKDSNNYMVQEAKMELRRIKLRMEFIHDEIRMYKLEMMKWRELSMKLMEAVRKTIKQAKEIDNNFSPYSIDVKVHLRIVNYDGVSWRHPVVVALIGNEFGVLTYDQIF